MPWYFLRSHELTSTVLWSGMTEAFPLLCFHEKRVEGQEKVNKATLKKGLSNQVDTMSQAQNIKTTWRLTRCDLTKHWAYTFQAQSSLTLSSPLEASQQEERTCSCVLCRRQTRGSVSAQGRPTTGLLHASAPRHTPAGLPVMWCKTGHAVHTCCYSPGAMGAAPWQQHRGLCALPRCTGKGPARGPTRCRMAPRRSPPGDPGRPTGLARRGYPVWPKFFAGSLETTDCGLRSS